MAALQPPPGGPTVINCAVFEVAVGGLTRRRSRCRRKSREPTGNDSSADRWLGPGGTTPMVVVPPTLLGSVFVGGMSGWTPRVSWPGGNFVAGGDEWCCSHSWWVRSAW